MKKNTYFLLSFVFCSNAYALEINNINVNDIKNNGDFNIPVLSAINEAVKQATPATCEAAIAERLSYKEPLFRDAKNEPFRGFNAARYYEGGTMVVSQVLLTDKDVYYYYENCDICAALDKCDLATKTVTSVVAAHSADCTDLAPYIQGTVLYSACAAKPAVQLKACEAAMAKKLNYQETLFRDGQNMPFRGFNAAGYFEGGPIKVSQVLLTDKEVYYYYENCDICAALDKCELATGTASNVIYAHSLSCSNIAPYTQGNVLFNACSR